MKILITGGAGFIGVNLTLKLLSHKHKVTVLDNFITSAPININSINNQNLEFIKTDITKSLPGQVLDAKFDQIFHLACPTGVPNLTRLSEEMLLTCSSGTQNILELAKKTGAKMLFASSSEVYGEPLETPQKESYTGNVSTIGIRSPYEEGKRFSESLITAYRRKYNINTKIVRIFNTYGPYMNFSDTRVIPNMIMSTMLHKPVVIYGKGLQRRTFCYVDDLIDGFIRIINSHESETMFNLGSDREISILELSQVILSITNAESKIEFRERPEHDHTSRMPDLTRVKKLGWEAKVSLKPGLVKTIEWAKKNYNNFND